VIEMKSSSLKIVYAWIYQVYGLLCFLLSLIFFGVRVYGQKKISLWQKRNNLGSIFVARHFGCWDPVFLAAAFWKLQFRHIFLYSTTRYVAKDNLRTLFKCLCLSPYIIFINQKNTKRDTIREMISLIKQGVSIVIFPEGTVVPKDKRVGGLVSLVIEQTEKTTNQKIAVFPLRIEAEGPYGKPDGDWIGYLLRKVRIKVKIGDHISLEDLEKMLDNKESKKETREAIIEELLNMADKI